MYSITNAQWLIGSETTVFALDSSYETSDTNQKMAITGFQQLVIVAFYSTMTSNTLSLKVEFSYDNGVTWGAEQIGVNGTPSSGVLGTTLNDREYIKVISGTTPVRPIRIPIAIGECARKTEYPAYVRVQVKEVNPENDIKVLGIVYNNAS